MDPLNESDDEPTSARDVNAEPGLWCKSLIHKSSVIVQGTSSAIKNMTTEEWRVKVEKSYKRATFFHASFNSYITFEFTADMSSIIPMMFWIRYFLSCITIMLHVYRISKAIYGDYYRNQGYKETLRTLMSILGSYIGGHIGSLLGSVLGGWIGGEIVGLLGWEGRVIMDTVGSLVGRIIGAIMAAKYFSNKLEYAVCRWYSGTTVNDFLGSL